MSDSATGSSGPVTQGYMPLTRMQEKAAQLRQELDVLNKNERHAQFKRNTSIKVPGEASAAGRSGSRRLPRSSTMASSVGGPGGSGGGRTSFANLAMSLSGLGGGGGAFTSGLPLERPGSAAGAASRMSSRRVSNASGANTDVSGDERPFGGGASRSPSRRGGVGPRSSSRGAAMRDMQEHYAAAISRQNALEDHAAELENRVNELTADNERRQESYMRREAQLQGEIARLEDQLRVARGERPNHPAFGKATANIKELHAQVVDQIEGLLDAQAAALRTEEHSALRRFTVRLNELEAAVAAERGKPNKEDADWMEKTMALRTELETTQNIAQILDKKHALLAEENGRLRSQFKLQEEDREYLIKQTVALKKENAALRNQLVAALQEVATLNGERDDFLMALEDGGALGAAGGAAGGVGMAGRPPHTAQGRPMSAMSRPMSAVSARGGLAGPSGMAAGAGGGADSQIQIKIQRYEDVIESLKKLLEGERRRTKQARAAHTLELQQRTSLQAVLRQCIDDVRERRRALEAEGHREQSNAERAQARSRPLSGRGPGGSAPVSRPLSGTPLGAAAAMRRPGSAALSRPGSGRAAAAAVASAVRVSATGGMAPPGPPSFAYEQGQGGAMGGGGGGDAWGSDGVGAPLVLSAAEREALVEALLANEEVLKVVFDKTFPGVAPHPPSDPYLDRMAAWQEQRDAQVVANAKVLAATKNAVVPSAAALAASTPGGALVKEAAARPWVLNVDAMLSDFLGGGGGGAGARGGGHHGDGAGAASGGGAPGR
ncbi:hypothetical protein HYH02_008789 [Chlamydomonas schloesseri]|uniref:Cilia- and flagella-associated protein 157 n=1 Tax=Chlamydomonas schloesseri TaxID=2026947 RepID=A0A835WDD5_9CHLO|nr:hypothetical protein HYH02_008789 [Chlamydomonas schloesseri]|eukprot:KAG2445323.1 hypothetical protein HYH02_008789 [Chlamydomonas schloesseri]